MIWIDWLFQSPQNLEAGSTFLGVLVAGVGFFVAIYQLVQTQNALRASNTYQIQRDARERAERLNANSAFNTYVRKYQEGKRYSPKTIRAAEFEIRSYMHFYLSVYRQYQAGGISRSLSKTMGKDFNEFMKNAVVRRVYKEQYEARVYGTEIQRMVWEWCGKSTFLDLHDIRASSGHCST